MRRHGRPDVIVSDKLRPDGAARVELGAGNRRETGRWLNSRVGNSLLPFPRRGQVILRFRRMRSLQKFAANYASVCNPLNSGRSPSSRPGFELTHTAALAEWRGLWAE